MSGYCCSVRSGAVVVSAVVVWSHIGEQFDETLE